MKPKTLIYSRTFAFAYVLLAAVLFTGCTEWDDKGVDFRNYLRDRHPYSVIKKLNRQGNATFVDAEFWDDKNDTLFSGAKFKIAKGDIPIKKWIEKSGLEKCKKSEAVSLLVVGEKKDGCYIIGKTKNYWLRALAEKF